MRVFTFHLPQITKQQLLLLIIAIICFIGYVLLERKPNSVDFSKETAVERMPRAGLTLRDKEFFLDGKPLRILSGAIHYFRVVPEYWKDRLLKLKAMGLNTVETYVAWNLHEEVKGEFKFDGNLDIKAFIKIAQDLGLYVILRPGPYICSEWDFGGLPSWLLSDPHMKPRSMYPPFVQAGDQYLKALLPIVSPLQYSKGGPIIAFQIENEYGSYPDADVAYLEHLKMVMINGGITELLFTSDNHGDPFPSLPNVLRTINFGVRKDAKLKLEELKKTQPDKPVMVMEYWLGWFDHWGRPHHVRDAKAVADTMEEILKFGASVNLYMFHGGTNFGFMNGANELVPVTTSYDYDAPLSEAGDTTAKYHALKAMIIKSYASENSMPPNLSHVPANSPKKDYGKVEMQQQMTLPELLQHHIPVESDHVMPMEQLPVNNNGGQGYGFILYQAELTDFPKEIVMEQVFDRAQVILDSMLIHTYDASLEDRSSVHVTVNKHLTQETIKDLLQLKSHKLEILVENMGRTNIGWDLKKLRKGISGEVKIDDKSHNKWRIYPLEFKPHTLSRIKEKGTWSDVSAERPQGPHLYRGTFQVNDEPQDTFLNMENWTKGVCFINGHNLGRYWIKGPQGTLYVPAPWLQKGQNELIIFELHDYKSAEVSFTTSPIFKE